MPAATRPDTAVLARAVVRVASVPADHVYVRHLAAATGDDGVLRLPDPPPAVDSPLPGQWWPPAMLDARWIRAHRDDFDVFHVHFGFDALAPSDLEAVVGALRELGKPLVYTVHDLRNPHHALPAEHDRHLDILIPAAAAIITLTPGAAAVVERRWGRRAHVLPHPHVVDFARMRASRPGHDGFVVGVHAKSVRPSMAPLPVVAAMLPLNDELPGLRIVVDVHRDVFDEDGARHDARLRRFLLDHAAAGRLELSVHDFYPDPELFDYLQGLDVSVLPYRFGTHSGWLEACYDLGTAVVAPDCGFYAQQRRCLPYHHDERALDMASLQDAVRRAYANRPRWRATVAERVAERDQIAVAHRAVYEAVQQ